jgi:hypothetical protein
MIETITPNILFRGLYGNKPKTNKKGGKKKSPYGDSKPGLKH